jgi:periplasmic protein TonB
MAAHIEGDVLLRLRIETDGSVGAVEVVRSSGHEILDNAAVTGVAKWHGMPAQIAGQPIAATVLLPVRFEMH